MTEANCAIVHFISKDYLREHSNEVLGLLRDGANVTIKIEAGDERVELIEGLRLDIACFLMTLYWGDTTAQDLSTYLIDCGWRHPYRTVRV